MPFTDSQYSQRTKRAPHNWGGYAENQEQFEIDYWRHCNQDVNVESALYQFYPNTELAETGISTPGFINRLEYQGWRLNPKYYASHPEPCFTFNFLLDNNAEDKIKALQNILTSEQFSSLCGINVDDAGNENTLLTVTFLVQNNSKDLNKFFNLLLELNPRLIKVIQDIKETISYDCFRWILWELEGRSRKHRDMSKFEDACSKLHHNAFEGVPSPFYLAATYLKDLNEPINAVWLLGNIPPDHWQYEQAQKLRKEIAATEGKQRSEIENLKKQLEDLRLMLNQASSLATHNPEPAMKIEPLVFLAVSQLNAASQLVSDIATEARQEKKRNRD